MCLVELKMGGADNLDLVLPVWWALASLWWRCSSWYAHDVAAGFVNILLRDDIVMNLCTSSTPFEVKLTFTGFERGHHLVS